MPNNEEFSPFLKGTFYCTGKIGGGGKCDGRLGKGKGKINGKKVKEKRRQGQGKEKQ